MPVQNCAACMEKYNNIHLVIALVCKINLTQDMHRTKLCLKPTNPVKCSRDWNLKIALLDFEVLQKRYRPTKGMLWTVLLLAVVKINPFYTTNKCVSLVEWLFLAKFECYRAVWSITHKLVFIFLTFSTKIFKSSVFNSLRNVIF